MRPSESPISTRRPSARRQLVRSASSGMPHPSLRVPESGGRSNPWRLRSTSQPQIVLPGLCPPKGANHDLEEVNRDARAGNSLSSVHLGDVHDLDRYTRFLLDPHRVFDAAALFLSTADAAAIGFGRITPQGPHRRDQAL